MKVKENGRIGGNWWKRKYKSSVTIVQHGYVSYDSGANYFTTCSRY